MSVFETAAALRFRHLAYTVVIFVLAAASYQANFFGTAGQVWFTNHDRASESLIIAGVIANRAGINPSAAPGFISMLPFTSSRRSTAENLILIGQPKLVPLYFRPYTSQYGVQTKLFSFLSRYEFDFDHFRSLAALSMALVVSIFFCELSRYYGRAAAFLFSAVLAFSPWMVVSARNLYWLPFTWFLPALLSLMMHKRLLSEVRTDVCLALLAIYGAALIKFACGYEYASAVLLATVLPLFLPRLTKDYSFRKLIGRSFMIGSVIIASFITALALHAGAHQNGFAAGLESIKVSALKRVPLADSDLSAKAACKNGNQACLTMYREGLNASPLYVVSRYFLFHDFIPYSHRFGKAPPPNEILPLDQEVKAELKSALSTLDIHRIRAAFDRLSATEQEILKSKITLCPVFLMFIFIVGIDFFKANTRKKWAYLVALSAPISWFVVAKGHSYHHFYLNYVLWYLLFIPLAFMFLFSEDGCVGNYLTKTIARLKAPVIHRSA